jgi:DNA-binding CsgD family transcriptional regulator
LLVTASTALARVALARGDASGALSELAASVEIVRRQCVWVWAAEAIPIVCAALVQLGRRADAGALHAEFRAGVARLDAPLAEAAVPLSAGYLAEAVGDGDRAGELFDLAAKRFTAMRRPYAALRAREAQGRSLLSAGYKQPMVSVAAQFTALGAHWDASRCAETLQRHGISIPHRRGRRGYGTALSPRERAVADLAGQGKTNREIAEALFISVRTVEAHVANAMRKRSATTRHQLGSP